MTRDIVCVAPDRGDLFDALFQHRAIAEHGAIRLHGLLHAKAQRRRRRAALGVTELVEAGERGLVGIFRQIRHASFVFDRFRTSEASGAAEDDEIDQRIGAEAVGAVHRNARRLADGHQARHDVVGVAVLLGQNLAVIVRRNAAHVVMDGRQHRDRLTAQIDARENLARSR